MANRITVSTVAPAPLAGPVSVDRMITFWQEQFARVLPDRPDLIVTPECCDRFACQKLAAATKSYYVNRGDAVRDAMGKVAREHRCYIAYSAVRAMDDGSFRNSVQILDRNGHVAGVYDKNHVVIEETTVTGTLCGSDAPLITCDFGQVACVICFDLNFESLRRKYIAAKPDLLLFCSVYHGGLMQAYWAYACRAHFVAAVTGQPSAIVNPAGTTVATTTNYHSYVTASINLDCRMVHLDYNQEKLDRLKAHHGKHVTIYDPGHLGSVLVTSESDKVPVAEMVRAFEIELLDDYMKRASMHHQDQANIAPVA